jgi:diguanylate cyclase (GGDEF)-like protein/PAS domain S-box-containing protein
MNIIAWFLQIFTIFGLVRHHSFKNESNVIDTMLFNQSRLETSCHKYLYIKIYLTINDFFIQTNHNLIPQPLSLTALANEKKNHVAIDKLEPSRSYIKFIIPQNILNRQQNKIKIANLLVNTHQLLLRGINQKAEESHAESYFCYPENKHCIILRGLYFNQGINQLIFVVIPGINLSKKNKYDTYKTSDLSLMSSIIKFILTVFCIRWLIKFFLNLTTQVISIANTQSNNLLNLKDKKENHILNFSLKSSILERTKEISQIKFINNFELPGINLFLFSLEGNILAINPSACQMLGYSNSELINLSLNDIIHQNDQALEFNSTKELLISEIPHHQIEKRFVHKNGQIIWVLLTASLVYNAQNQPMYFIGQLQDITQHKLAEIALQESEASLRSFYDSSPMMMGIVEIAEDDIIHLADNLAAAQFFGKTVEEMKNKKASEIGVSREIINKWLCHYRESAAKKSPVRFEYIHKCEYTAKWFSATVSPICVSNDNYSKFSYIVVDITEHKQIQENLEIANVQLTNWVRELEERNREIILLGKMSKVLQTCSSLEEAHQVLAGLVQPLFPEFFGALFIIKSENNSIGFVASWGDEKFKHQLYSSHNESLLSKCENCYLIEVNNRELSHHQVNKCQWNSETFCIPIVAQGKLLGILHLCANKPEQFNVAKQQLALTVVENISLTLANLKLYEELQQQSIRDPLTGLYNRRYLEEYLEREIQRAMRNSLSLAVMMIDVDHFKQFNDKFGHEAGDTVLRELGNFLQKEFRGSDVVCRYGGEEFTIILPEISKQNAFNRAEKVRKGVKHLNIQHWSNRLNAITISLGVACFPEDGLTGTALMQAADEALYSAKQLGRDRVVSASQLTSYFNGISLD